MEILRDGPVVPGCWLCKPQRRMNFGSAGLLRSTIMVMRPTRQFGRPEGTFALPRRPSAEALTVHHEISDSGVTLPVVLVGVVEVGNDRNHEFRIAWVTDVIDLMPIGGRLEQIVFLPVRVTIQIGVGKVPRAARPAPSERRLASPTPEGPGMCLR